MDPMRNSKRLWLGLGLMLLGLVLAPAESRAQPTFTETVLMADGVGLTTDVYLPTTGAGPWPVLMIRTPYGRAGLLETATGYQAYDVAAVVVQDLRGRPTSGGVDCIFRCDGTGAVQDGVDTLDWIDLQTWSDGQVVSYGGSALGVVQYMLAPAAHPTHEAMWTIMATPNFYDDALFPGGVFRESMVTGWLGGQGSSFFLTDIANHPLADSFWDPVQTADQVADVQVPTVHVGGWYDIFSQGTLDAFMGYQHQGGAGALGRQKLIMGPWVHGEPRMEAGELTYPTSALDTPYGIDTQLLLWLAHHLGIAPNQPEIDAIPTVQYYVMGDVNDAFAPGNQWRSANDWPIPAALSRYYLHAGGDLSGVCPDQTSPASSYTYDPSDPSPTLGGANLNIPAGSYNQAAVEARGDVLVFTSSILTAPLEITGRVRAHLWVSINTVDTDVMVRMTDVYPDGRSMLVLDGAARLASRGVNDAISLLTPGELVPVVVDLASTSIILAPGHRLRISVTSSNWPRFRANPNDGTSFGATASPQPVQVSLHHDAEHLSYLEAPNPNADPSEVNLCEPTTVVDAGVPMDAAAPTSDADVTTPDGATADASPDPGSQPTGCACNGFGAPGKSPGHAPLFIWLLIWLGLALRCRSAAKKHIDLY